MNLFAAAAALAPSDAAINELLRGTADEYGIVQGMFSYVSPKGVEYDLSKRADTLFPPVEAVDEVNSEDDATIPQIEDSGRPGSAERVAAYREWYANNPGVSPNEGILSEDEEATRYIHNVAYSQAKHATPLKEGLALMATWAMEDERLAAIERGEIDEDE